MSKPDTANIQPLYWLSVINQGAADAMDATVAPRPKVTKTMGMAQQSKVPVVVNSSSQLHERGLLFASCLII